MPSDEETEAAENWAWLFDCVLQFLESDRFDAAVMDFVDENCEHFDNEDENKFIYTGDKSDTALVDIFLMTHYLSNFHNLIDLNPYMSRYTQRIQGSH
jgi:hypothetical protein